MLTAVKDYLKGMMNGKTTIPTKAWKDEYTKLTAERKTLNQRYLALKEEVKEAEKIRKSVYSILRQEQRERLTMNGRPKQPKYARNKNVLVIAKKSLCMNASEKAALKPRRRLRFTSTLWADMCRRTSGKVILTPEDQEALRKKEERKDRLHQNYLRRKANGKLKEYEDRIKTEKRRQMEAKKAALRAEDMAKGVFYIAGSVPTQDPQKGINFPARATII